ncbi:MAG: MarR family winged helix-turn-helix transcriptional regulator [Oscillospiraceae bacterium]|jgi:DNA-binding MarR family transcriptional regulator
MEQYASIGRNMNITDKYFRLYLRDALKPYDLNAAEGTVLLSMYGKSGSTEQQIFDSIHAHRAAGNTQDELIGELHYDKGVMTRTMKALEDKGYVLRRDNPADSRSYIFSLTEKAQAFKATLLGLLRQWNVHFLAGIDENTLKIVEGALNKMTENAIQYCREYHAKIENNAGEDK